MTSSDNPRPDRPDPPHVRFVGGTLVLEGIDRTITPPPSFQWVNAKWRCPAVHYRAVRPWLRERSIRNHVPRWRKLALNLRDDREPHSYQTEALQAWLDADRWGSVVLPTGAGKTFLALQAIAHSAVSTLIVVPTLDLLHQWYARLENRFGGKRSVSIRPSAAATSPTSSSSPSGGPLNTPMVSNRSRLWSVV